MVVVGLGSCADRLPPTIHFEFHDGFFGLPWGSTRPALDSLTRETDHLKVVADLDETPGHQVTVVRDSIQDYYLEWSAEGRLCGVNTIREHAVGAEMDSLVARLIRGYGEPKVTHQGSYQHRRWGQGKLTIEVITTDHYYSLKVQTH